MSLMNLGEPKRSHLGVCRQQRRPTRRAMTLTELLVVVSIIVLLSSILVPLVQPILRGQRVREAARQLNVYLAGAQARAVELGRPAGIWIERAGHEPTDPLNSWYTSYRIYPAEQPEPYTGDLLESRVRLRPNPTDMTIWEAWYDWDPMQPAVQCCGNLAASINQAKQALNAGNDALANTLPIALPGDRIRFGGRDPWYVIDQIDALKITFLVRPDQVPTVGKLFRPPPTSGAVGDLLAYQPGVSFEIFRRPRRSSSTPLELPNNTGIDLSLSGYGSPYNSPYALLPAYAPFIYVDPQPFAARFREISPEHDIVIMFKPEGGVDRVYYVAHELEMLSFWEVPQGMISLLLARADQIGRDSQKNLMLLDADYRNRVPTYLGEANLRDQDNIWLSISTHTGRIQSAPNGDAFVDAFTGYPLASLPLTPNVDARNYLQNARRFATTGQSMGGQ
jgi:prepilin-type N-terminal cleavage/methylation domain-containing protein